MSDAVRLIFFTFSIGFLPFEPGKVNGAEQPRADSLEQYLRKLAYEPVAFTYERNHPIVEGQLGDKKCSFAVDTGWTVTRLDPAAASGFKTLTDLGAVSDDPFVRRFNSDSIVVIEKFKLGRAEFTNQPAEREKIEPGLITGRYRGILGFDFLLRNFCLIDCLGHRLYVRGQKPSTEVSTALAHTLQRSGYTGVPLHGDFYFKVATLINGEAAELVVDTGSSFSAIDESEEKRLSLHRVREDVTGSHIPQDVGKQQNTVLMGTGKIGSHRMRVVKLDTFQIGGLNWRNGVFAIGDLKAWGLLDPTGKKRFSGTLGPDTLALQSALIDFSTRMLWFKPDAKSK